MSYRVFFFLGIFFTKIFASESFIIQELDSGKIIEQKGDLSSQVSPCSTFKIALSLMGFDSGILQNENLPVWTYEEIFSASIGQQPNAYEKDYPLLLKSQLGGLPDKEREKTVVFLTSLHKKSHDPKSWIRNSCAWYSQAVTTQIGWEQFRHYVQMFHYGNEDISGDEGKNNGLTNSWLSSSLGISPLEQIAFLQSILTKKFPLSSHAYEETKKIFFLETLPNGWGLNGKTGTGISPSGYSIGWFVGWITKEEKTLLIAFLIQNEKNEDLPLGQRAKNRVKDLVSGEIFH